MKTKEKANGHDHGRSISDLNKAELSAIWQTHCTGLHDAFDPKKLTHKQLLHVMKDHLAARGVINVLTKPALPDLEKMEVYGGSVDDHGFTRSYETRPIVKESKNGYYTRVITKNTNGKESDQNLSPSLFAFIAGSNPDPRIKKLIAQARELERKCVEINQFNNYVNQNGSEGERISIPGISRAVAKTRKPAVDFNQIRID